MRILHVVLTRGFAGSERSTAESCNEQCKDHEVVLVVRRDHRDKHGMSIVDHIDPRVRVIKVPRLILTQSRLAAVISRFAPDIIHCHLRRATRLVARINPPCATVSTLHIKVNGPHFMQMDGLICNARWQIDDIPPGYAGLVHKANNSLIPHRRLAADEVASLRAELQVPEGALLIGGVGRLTDAKGWETLVDAVKLLPDLKVKVVIFGEGTSGSALRKRAEGDARLAFAGYRKNVKDYYQVFDLLVCPSRFEPLPRVMLEAMDGGVPVVASDADGCRELIEDYGGDMFPVDDVRTLADILARHASNPAARTCMDLSRHHVHVANAAVVDFYRQLVRAKGKASES